MKEYPATSRPFQVNGKEFKMQKFMLLLQAQVEDENVAVSFRDVVESCTDMKQDDLDALSDEQFSEIYDLIHPFTYESEKSAEGEPKKAIEVIAWLISKGHADAQYYRFDFAETVVSEMLREFGGADGEKKQTNAGLDDNEETLKAVFG